MNQQLFLEMIDAAINGKTIDLSEADEEFIRVAKEQTFLPFLYVASKDKKYKKYYIQSVLIHERINEVGKLIDNILNEAKIPHIFLKGYELQNLYPDPNLRMMGDIDILVKQEDYDKSKSILIKNNFILNSIIETHAEFLYSKITIEIHNKLFHDSMIAYKFFKQNDLFINSTNELYLAYIICHYAKHFSKGAGLRPIVDIYLFMKKKKINFKTLNTLLEELGLAKFYSNIMNTITIIFHDNTLQNNLDINLALDTIYYSLQSGIHGFGQNSNIENNQISRIGKGSKIKYILNRLFIPLSELFIKYPIAKCIITIPICYIYRFFYLLFNRKKELHKALSYKKDSYFVLLKDLGLIKKGDKIY